MNLQVRELAQRVEFLARTGHPLTGGRRSFAPLTSAALTPEALLVALRVERRAQAALLSARPRDLLKAVEGLAEPLGMDEAARTRVRRLRAYAWALAAISILSLFTTMRLLIPTLSPWVPEHAPWPWLAGASSVLGTLCLLALGVSGFRQEPGLVFRASARSGDIALLTSAAHVFVTSGGALADAMMAASLLCQGVTRGAAQTLSRSLSRGAPDATAAAALWGDAAGALFCAQAALGHEAAALETLSAIQRAYARHRLAVDLPLIHLAVVVSGAMAIGGSAAVALSQYSVAMGG
ncbi:MAG: hypothetical protein AB2A00_05130 [Myxococcota bacterium]